MIMEPWYAYLLSRLGDTMRNKWFYSLFILGLSTISTGVAQAQEGDTFDSNFLFRPEGQALPSDLSAFSHANRVLPGAYQATVEVNGLTVGIFVIDFVAPADHSSQDAVVCLTKALLEELGVKTAAFIEYETARAEQCLDISVIPSASYEFKAQRSVLSFSIPQAALDRSIRGAIPIEQWNDGETVFWTSYQFSHFRSHIRRTAVQSNSHTTFAGLKTGFNYGAWRFRSSGSLYHSRGKSQWNFTENYIERGLPAWRSTIRLGDSTTSSRGAFISNRIRGIKIESDDSMLAAAEQGYAPTIEGFAHSSAQVTIKQNGAVVYSTFVAPGPFVINDLYAVPGGGDLEVEIAETNGQVIRYVQPYSVLPGMLRQGRWQYSFSLGKYRAYASDSEEPVVGQLTVAHGLPWGVTIYGGVLGAKKYLAHSLGLAFNLGSLGGVSTDIVQSRSKDYRSQTRKGHALRIQYAKSLSGIGTHVRLMGYRYSSGGYRDLDQALLRKQVDERFRWNKSHEYQMLFSQSLGKTYGAVSVSYARIQYHNNIGASNTFNVGYSNQIGVVGVFLSFNRVQSQWQKKSHSVMLNLTFPLGSQALSVGYGFSRQDNGNYAHDAQLSGTALENNALTYSLRAGLSKENQRTGNNFYGSASYKHSAGQISASMARDHRNYQMQAEMNGSVVVDEKGVLLGQYLSDTAIIVETPHARDVQLQSHPTIKTNSTGRALIPFAAPYRINNIALAPGYFNDHVTLQQTIQSVVPTKGAIVRVVFETQTGRSLLFKLRYQEGYVPFGALVYGETGEQKGVVGPVGRFWLTGLEQSSTYVIKWGEGEQNYSCAFIVSPEEVADLSHKEEKEMSCEPM